MTIESLIKDRISYCLYDLKYHDGIDDVVIDHIDIGDLKEDGQWKVAMVDVYFKGSIPENDLAWKLLPMFLGEDDEDEYRFVCHKL